MFGFIKSSKKYKSSAVSFNLYDNEVLWLDHKISMSSKHSLVYIMLAVLLWSRTVTAAKTYRNEELNSVRHHSHHEHQSRQTRQQRETGIEEKGYCAPYNGKICKDYIRHQVWYSREDPTGGWKNEQITTALWEELIGDLNGLCRIAAEVSF